MQSFRPQADSRYLDRERLLSQLPDEPGRAVWLEAPYGYGKSVLASQWARDLERDDWRTLWLAPGGSDPRALLADTLELPTSAPWAAVLDELWQKPTLLVLEDLEALDDHELLTPLLRDLRGLVLLASRSSLKVSELPRLLTQGRLIHLRTEDLAFDPTETSELVGDTATARRLWATTNGWPLPLHFAALTGEMPEGAALLEGMKASVTAEAWREALLLATLSVLPIESASPATKALARSGFVQLGDSGYRLHALVAESILAAYPQEAVDVLRREAHRLPPLLIGEACERCGDLDTLATLFETPRAQVYRRAPANFLRWDSLLPAGPSPRRRLTVGAVHKVLGRYAEAIAHLEGALATGELEPDDEILALKELCWCLAIVDPSRAAQVVAQGEAILDDVDPELAGRFLSDASFVDMMAERFDDADAKLVRALEYLPPDNLFRTGARINLALNRWDRHGDYDGRLAVQLDTLDTVWRVYPNDAPGQCRDVAMMYWWVGDFAAARRYLERAREGERANPLVGLEASAALAALDGDVSPFPRLLERAALLGDHYTLDVIAMHALNTLPLDAPDELVEGYLASVAEPVLALGSYARIRAGRGQVDEVLARLDAVLAEYSQRPYQIYLRAARYRITRSASDLEAYLGLTTAGKRLLPGLVPIEELPRERPDLGAPYSIGAVLGSGWKALVEQRLGEIPNLELRTMGELEIRVLGRALDLTDRQKQLALLFSLGKGREEVAESMWPEVDVAKQRNNMGVQVSLLRKKLEPWGVPTYLFEDGLVRFDSDHSELMVALSAGDAATVCELYREPFAPGLVLEALEEHRAWLREQVVDCLREAALRAEPTVALRYLQRVIELDPLHEEAVRHLLERLVERGRAADARRHYQAFAARLRAELGLEPLAETRAVLALP